MKKFMGEFKKFMHRGNVIDMSIGVIVGSSFTAIVTALTNNILKPLTNWVLASIFGANSLSEVYTFLKTVYAEDGSVDLAQSIYIDWGSFINAIFNFIIIAFVLFCILKTINNIREEIAEAKSEIPTKAQKKELKAAGIKLRDKAAVSEFLKKKAEEEKALAEAKAAEERAKNPTTEDLLKMILAEIKK